MLTALQGQGHLEPSEKLLGILVLCNIDGLAIIVFEGVPEAHRLEGLLLRERHAGKGRLHPRATGVSAACGMMPTPEQG